MELKELMNTNFSNTDMRIHVVYSEGDKKLLDKVLAGPPCQLKTIEVDVEKKIFKVNGVPFGERCTGFSISCDAAEGFLIRMDIDTTVQLAGYDMDGEKKTDHAYEKHGQ